MKELFIEKLLIDRFLKIVGTNGFNGKWAYGTLEYEVFVLHAPEFWALSEDDQWEVRKVLDAIKKVHC